ncbi:hypothetical protein [Streptomyces rubellomurinus]|uniref:hypothetical protein n=1 Tax=Streptomyces rubellomurinus (strain ATCC 31215) TaxID=359131 RepID=UPI0005F0CC30|nr:hypothetical protein [Streptomyces rubellomurinus]
MTKLLVDLAERTAATYLEAVIGLLLVGGVTGLSSVQSAAIAAVPAGLAVIKGALGVFIGRADTAALLPTRIDPASRP